MGDDFWYSIGLRIDPDGTLADVRWGSPADKAKLAPKNRLTQVNETAYSSSSLHQAIAAAKSGRSLIRLTFRQEGETVSTEVHYHDGERFPALVRSKDSSAPACLDLITTALTFPRDK